MDQEFEMIAKTFKGLEEVLAGELIELGANNVQIQRRAVSFSGDKAVLYKANLCLRTASRVLVPIATFAADDADAVYAAAKNIHWGEFMGVNTSFAIDATVYSETFKHSRYVTYRVKDAIADYWMEKEDKRPNVQVTNPDLYINVHIADRQVTISLDSSGESLHKRGYRVANTEAPINEALAAGMLLLAGWKGESDFYDPMCGSGTLLIEAALIALNIAPGIYRKGFAFEKWKDFDAELFNEVYNDDSRERVFIHHIYGSDASFYAVQTALKNVASTSLQRYIEVKQIRLEEIKLQPENAEADTVSPTAGALVMMNPPYGERLAYDRDVIDLYQKIGTALKHQFRDATAWIISSNEDAIKSIGLKPTQKLSLMNGELDCQFNQYELFAGKHETWKAEHPEKPHREFQNRDFAPIRKPRFEGKPRFDRQPRFDRDGEKPFRSFDKPFRRREKRKSEERPFRPNRFNSDSEGRPFERKPRSYDRKPRFDRDGGERSFGDHKPRFDHEGGNRRFGDRKPSFGGRKPHFDHRGGDRNFSRRPRRDDE